MGVRESALSGEISGCHNFIRLLGMGDVVDDTKGGEDEGEGEGDGVCEEGEGGIQKGLCFT